MQMLCLKNADTPRVKRWGLWLAACVLSHAQIGFAADSPLPDSAFEALQKQAQQWAATHPSFQGKQVQVVPVDPRITVQTCQQNLQFEQPFPNQPAIRVRCAQPAWQLFVNLNTGQANTAVNRASPSAPALYKVLVSKELLKRGTLIKPEMFSYAEMPAAGMENQIISDTKLLKNMELVRDLTPSMGAEDFAFMLQVKPGAYFRLGQGDAACGGGFLHSPRYDFNDEVLPLGAAMFCALAERALAAA